jgi:hypothetical protein
MSLFRVHVRPVVAGSLVSVALFGCATAAHAQAPAADSTPAAPAPVAQTSASSGSHWALIGGYERDSHDASYGFFGPAYVRPIRSNLAFTARLFGHYLTYDFSDATITTNVKSRGADAAVGLRFGERHTFSVYAGPSISWRETEEVRPTQTVTQTDTRKGANVGAEAYLNPTSRSNIHALANYNTTDEYIWTRVGVKQQVTSGKAPISLGVEGIAQGNDDIRSLQGGGLLEIAPSNASIMLRGGYKRSTFEVGPSRSGGYFGIGLYWRIPS